MGTDQATPKKKTACTVLFLQLPLSALPIPANNFTPSQQAFHSLSGSLSTEGSSFNLSNASEPHLSVITSPTSRFN